MLFCHLLVAKVKNEAQYMMAQTLLYEREQKGEGRKGGHELDDIIMEMGGAGALRWKDEWI